MTNDEPRDLTPDEVITPDPAAPQRELSPDPDAGPTIDGVPTTRGDRVFIPDEELAKLGEPPAHVLDDGREYHPDDDGPIEDELAALPADDIPTDALLAANGFAALRGQIMEPAGALERVPMNVMEAVIVYAEQTERKQRAAGAPRQQLDAIATDIRILKAVRRFKQEVKKIAEADAARARLTQGINGHHG